MRVVDDKRGLDARPVWLVGVSISVSLMVVLVLYHFGEVFHVYVAIVAGGFVGAGLSTSGSLGTSWKVFLKRNILRARSVFIFLFIQSVRP